MSVELEDKVQPNDEIKIRVALLLMCGIAGVVRHGGAIAPDPAAALGAALAHRGPDGHGVWRSPGGDVLLVHTRLAIIDPGPSGAQPMATPDGRHRIVFNGEVYNYRELRRSLEARGERFTTGSDTEVLLRLLALRRRGRPGAGPRDVRARLVGRAGSARCCSRAIGSASSRCMSRRRTASIAFASEIHALVSSGLVERTDRSRPASSGIWHGAPCRRRSPGSPAWRACCRVRGCAAVPTDGCVQQCLRGRRARPRAAPFRRHRSRSAGARRRRRAGQRRRASGRRCPGRHLSLRRDRFVGDPVRVRSTRASPA